MKNSLEKFIEENGMKETKAMNILQSNGVVSDLCWNAADVATIDHAKAIEFLKRFSPVDLRAKPAQPVFV